MVLFGGAAYAQLIADGFDYPVGKPDGTGYRVDLRFGETCTACGADRSDLIGHLAEDWNKGSGNADLGDAVYAVAHGVITYAENALRGWGNVIIVRHRLPDGREVESMYAHLDEMIRTSGEVRRGEQIGTIGRGYQYSDGHYDYEDTAHLHFEVRTTVAKGVGPGYNRNASGWTCPPDFNGWTCPSQFIGANRQLGPPPPSADFELSVDPSSRTVVQGSATTYRVNLQSRNGFASPVEFFALGLPGDRVLPGTRWSPPELTPPADGTASTTFTLVTDEQTPTGSFSMTFEGRGGGRTRGITAGVVVVSPEAGDFALSVDPPSRTVVQGTMTTFTVTLQSRNGFAGLVDLFALNLPGDRVLPGTGWDPSQVTLLGNESATAIFTLTTDEQTPTGVFSLILEGRSGALSRSIGALVTIKPPSPPPPNSTFWLAFIEGDPAVPGDGIIADASAAFPFTTFQLTSPIRLSDLSGGFTYSVFPPLGSPALRKVQLGIRNGQTSGSCQVYFAAQDLLPSGTTSVNGVTGVVTNVSSEWLESVLAWVNTEQPGCGHSLENLFFNHLNLEMADNSGFLTVLDAAAVGMGVGNVPREGVVSRLGRKRDRP